MKDEMFDDQGKFVERDVHVQVFDHSQELPAVEVLDEKAIESISISMRNYVADLENKMESIR